MARHAKPLLIDTEILPEVAFQARVDHIEPVERKHTKIALEEPPPPPKKGHGTSA